MPAITSGKVPKSISQTGNVRRRSLPSTPTYSSRPSMYSSTSASELVCSWMNSMRSFKRSASATTEACEMPSDASSVTDFTNSGNLSLRGSAVALALADHGEARRRDAVIGEDLLRQRLVARNHHAARIAAGVRQLHQLEERDHVLVVSDDALEFLEQVESHLGLPVGDHRAQLGEIVAQAQGLDLVPGLLQRRGDVVFGPELVDFLVTVSLEAGRRHETLMHQHQDSRRLHSGRSAALIGRASQRVSLAVAPQDVDQDSLQYAEQRTLGLVLGSVQHQVQFAAALITVRST